MSLTPERVRQILVVGRNSFIANALFDTDRSLPWRTIGHSDPIDDSTLDGIDTVINFALHPDLRRGEYDSAKDLDFQIAMKIRDKDIRYVLVSSRKVYDAEHQWNVKEGDNLEPDAPYGMNKAITEKKLTAILHDKLSILRVANIVGYEVPRSRGSFMAMMLGGLKEEDTITLDVNPSVRRDFVSAPKAGEALARFLNNPQPGIFNFGSGHAVAMGDIAHALIEGFGRGKINVINDRVHDEFVLNTEKFSGTYGEVETPESLLTYCKELGKRHATQ
ncbi:MAG: sugar nucleotide-binding protein [Fimbriimonadaceae bacterium]